MANYLVTGAAGFIGSRVTEMLIEQGHTVTGVDNLNDAYDVRMKEYRLRKLQALPGFTFQKLDISDRAAVEKLPAFEAVINLAARAGVRASVENPWVFLTKPMSPGRSTCLTFAARKGSENSSWLPPPASMAQMRPFQRRNRRQRPPAAAVCRQ